MFKSTLLLNPLAEGEKRPRAWKSFNHKVIKINTLAMATSHNKPKPRSCGRMKYDTQRIMSCVGTQTATHHLTQKIFFLERKNHRAIASKEFIISLLVYLVYNGTLPRGNENFVTSEKKKQLDESSQGPKLRGGGFWLAGCRSGNGQRWAGQCLSLAFVFSDVETCPTLPSCNDRLLLFCLIKKKFLSVR